MAAHFTFYFRGFTSGSYNGYLQMFHTDSSFFIEAHLKQALQELFLVKFTGNLANIFGNVIVKQTNVFGKKNIIKKNPTIKSPHLPPNNLIQLPWSINHFWLV